VWRYAISAAQKEIAIFPALEQGAAVAGLLPLITR
jgi:hypothetical protein